MAIEKIKFKRSFTPGYVPAAGEVSDGELVLNIADRQIFTADKDGAIISVGGSGGGGGGSGLPVGAIATFISTTLPNGFLLCDGSVFDRLTYPDLYKALGDSNVLPNLMGRYLKGHSTLAAPLTNGPWMLPDHTHDVTGSTEPFDYGAKTSSSFDYGTKTTSSSGARNTTFNTPVGAYTYVERGNTLPVAGRMYGGSGNTTVSIAIDAAHTHTLEIGSHTHTTPIGSHSHLLSAVTLGIREAFNKGDKVDVDHVTVVYAIKAAGYVTNEGLMEVEGMKAELEHMKTQQREFNGSMVGSEQQFPPLPAGQTPGEMWVPKDGSELLRSSYPALWAWAQLKGLVVTEEKWQELKAASHGGAVAVYSSGDGSTTFRVPNIGEYGMVQRPIPNGQDVSSDDYKIGHADQNKAHTHTATFKGSALPAHNHTLTLQQAAGNGWHSSTQPFWGGDVVTRNGGTATMSSTSAGTPTGAVTVDSSGDETLMKHMWCSIWIYSGNNATLLPPLTPDVVEQVELNKKNIEDHELRITDLESGKGSGSGVPKFQVIDAEGFITQVGGGYAVNVSGGSKTIKLPLNPDESSVVYIKDYNGSCSTDKTITLETLDLIHGESGPLVLDRKNVSLVLSYINVEQGWNIVDGIGVDGDYGALEEKVDALSNSTGVKPFGAVGDIGLMYYQASSSINPGVVVPGSDLRYSNTGGGIIGTVPQGMWRCQGYIHTLPDFKVTLFTRIS